MIIKTQNEKYRSGPHHLRKKGATSDVYSSCILYTATCMASSMCSMNMLNAYSTMVSNVFSLVLGRSRRVSISPPDRDRGHLLRVRHGDTSVVRPHDAIIVAALHPPVLHRSPAAAEFVVGSQAVTAAAATATAVPGPSSAGQQPAGQPSIARVDQRTGRQSRGVR